MKNTTKEDAKYYAAIAFICVGLVMAATGLAMSCGLFRWVHP